MSVPDGESVKAGELDRVLAYCIREATSRHVGVETVQMQDGSFRLRIEGERKLHRMPIDIEMLSGIVRWDRNRFLDHVFDAVDSTVERVRADRAAAERRQREQPQWSPYPL